MIAFVNGLQGAVEIEVFPPCLRAQTLVEDLADLFFLLQDELKEDGIPFLHQGGPKGEFQFAVRAFGRAFSEMDDRIEDLLVVDHLLFSDVKS